ncbi:MAG: hypothetical protein DMF63_16000 [Acidobacteria bacterium]|nr:MAG: hypothetical protein DMF63_16000 [Acidobacteriota bacterium]
MKRCPECRRDFYDDSLIFCLDDGTRLLDGPPSVDGPATALLHLTPSSAEAETRAQIDIINPTAVLSSPDLTSKKIDKRLLAAPVIAVLLIAGFAGYRFVGSGNSKQIESIAVMPFVNTSGNADIEYLSDGMTETLIGSLSKLPALNVKARSIVFRYKGKDIDLKTIAKELGVQAILNGHVDQRGDRLSLSLELIDPNTENVIWTDQYDRKASDIVSLQTEIARDVSSKLRLKLSGSEEQALNKKYTDDPEAYRLYLQARFYLNKRVGKEFEKAEGYLRQAIERDPNFALAYVGLSEFVGQDDRPKAKENILRAIALDPQLPEAHGALAFQLTLDRDWAAAEREMNRALELDPNNVRTHQWSGTLALMTGRYDQCRQEFDRAIAIDPTLPDLYNNRGSCLVAAGRVDEGIEQVRKATEIDPGYAWSFSHLSFLLRMKGDHANSVEMRAHSTELLDRPDLAAALRDAFRQKGWNGYLHELLGQTTDSFRSRTRRASILAELGEKEESFKSLNDALGQSDWWLFSIKYDPAFDQMRDDPRFQAIAKKFEP